MASRFLYGIITILLCGIIYFIYSAFERYEENVDLGYSAKARANNYLATELYAHQQGIPATSLDSYLRIESLQDVETVFLTQSTQVIAENRVTDLLHWVEQGGHLIVAAQDYGNEEYGPLFERLQITVIETEYDGFFENPFADFFNNLDAFQNEDDKDEKKASDDNTKKEKNFSDMLEEVNEKLKEQSDKAKDKGDSKQMPSEVEKILGYEKSIKANELTPLKFAGVEGKVTASFNPKSALDHWQLYEDTEETDSTKLVYWTGSEYGIHFLQFERGTGLISILSDATPLNNQRIGYFDHALLWDILTDNSRRLAIIFGTNVPSLWSLMKTLMPETIFAFLIFLLLWLWHQSRRFTNVVEPHIQLRRSFAEHLEASAAFLWHADEQQKLLLPLREAIVLQAQRSVTGFTTGTGRQDLNALAKHSNLDQKLVEKAMQDTHHLSEDGFTQIVRLLQKIRESL